VFKKSTINDKMHHMSNNNKTLILGLIILLGVGGLIAYRMAANSSSEEAKPQQPVVQQTETPESTTTPTQTEGNDPESTYNELITVTAPTGSTRYVLTDNSEASYTVRKVYVGKPGAQVTGVTEDVVGAGWYDGQGKKFYLKANIGLDTLKSDSEQRDSDILPLFTPATASIVINGDNSTDVISMTEPFETQIKADLTIGSVTKTVTFNVNGMLDESKFTAEGTADILMSDFGIKAPSALNIFTVEDATVLKFKVEGMALEEAQTQE
jgi:polyisoprenoid-binding protein YceI